MTRESPTVVEIDLSALRANTLALKKRIPAGVKVLATVKSNAYGHGAVPVSRTLQTLGVDFFGVGTIDEGAELREAGIRKPILVLLGLIENGFERLLRYDLTPVLYDAESARRLNRFLEEKGRTLEVHLKIDTGMTRLGLLPNEAGRFFEELARLPRLKPAGLLSHLADADNDRFTEGQFARFRQVRDSFGKFFGGPVLVHLDNSLAAVDRRAVNGGGEGEMVRLGIALYGAYPVPRQARAVPLKPVLTWKTRVAAVKQVPKGTVVSYLRTFRTRRESRIGILPVGYADGYRRDLSNRASALCRGRRVPVVGMVCMDMFMVDLTAVRGETGDEVVLIGSQGSEEIRAEEVAKWAKTISYEIFCGISQRNRRIYREA